MYLFPRPAYWLTALLLAISCSPAEAGDNLLHPTSGAGKNQPAMLTADEVGYDQPNSTAIAVGHVEVVQADTILLADRVSYEQKTDRVRANGHVVILEPTGDVFFADDAVLTNKLEKGVVAQFRARLKDNSLFAAQEARKLNKNVTQLSNAVYSPCHVCQGTPGNPASAPLWQVEAKDATINEDTQRMTYHNAYFDVFGEPVLYTPYFSAPTPDAPSQSGLLMPMYFHATDLGSVVKEPVYINIAPNLDATLTPWIMTGEKPLLEAELRGMTQNASFSINGAITDTYNRDAYGNTISGSEIRGYIDAKGKIQLDPFWDAGVDAERTTDQTFLQLYRFAWSDTLTSKIYAERIEDRNYIGIQSLAFQGLELQDIDRESPYILPQAMLHFESDPLTWHSRLTMDSSALVLQRSQGDSDQRLSTSVGWKLPYITRGGQVFELDASVRGDAYNINDQTINATTGETFNGQEGRVMPQIDANWRYPFVNRFGSTGSVMIAPVVEATASPTLSQNSNIPNEDSQVAALSDLNLFSPDRYTGLDGIDSGPRGVVGTRGQVQFDGDAYVEWLVGQAYEQSPSSAFPLMLSNATNQSHVSDYVGRLEARYRWIDLTYNFRADRDSGALLTNEINAVFNLAPFMFDVTYANLRDDPLYGDQQAIFGNASVDLSKTWRWTLSGRENLGASTETAQNPFLPVSATNPLETTSGTVGLNTAIVYHNECMMVSTGVGRSYIDELDVKPSTTFSVLLTLKNFGNQNGSNANNIGGAGNLTTGGTDPGVNQLVGAYQSQGSMR